MRCGYYKDMIEKLEKLEEQHPGGYMLEFETNQIFDHEVFAECHGSSQLGKPEKIKEA